MGILAVVASAAVWGAPAVSAHATIVSTTPADGSHADVAPRVVSFDLSEPVTLVDGSVQLIDSEGTRHALAGNRVEDSGHRIVVVIDGELSDGAYLATARVISADTHLVSLSSRFTVGSVTRIGDGLEAGASTPGAERYLRYPSKAAVYLGVILSAGLLIAGRWVWPEALSGRRFRIVYRAGAALVIVGLLGRFIVQVAQQAGGLAGVSGSAVGAVLGSRLGIAVVVAVALSTVAFAFPPGTRPATGIVGYLQAVSAIVAVTLGGHGGSTETWPLSFAGTAIHLYAAAVWLGGVSFLIVVLPKITRLDRWHRVAGAHVLLVIAAGAILAMIQVRPIQALVTTVYGVVLLGKIALVVSAVAAGYLTYRRYLDCSTLGHDGGGEVALRRPRVLLVEAGLASAVLAATSVLSSVTPAEDSYTTDVRTELDFGASGILDVEIDSIRRGPQSLTVRFAIPAGYDPSAELSGVEVYLSSVEANVTRMAVDLTRTGPDDDQITWESDGLIVPAAGEWTVTVRFESLGGPKLASFDYVVL